MQQMNGTDNPQAAQESRVGASNSSQFQESAGPEVLSQNRELQVVNTGKPNDVVKDTGITAGAIAFVVISSAILVFIAMSVFKWVMKQPKEAGASDSGKASSVSSASKATKTTSSAVKPAAKPSKQKKSKPPVKKKSSKSKRKK